MIGLWAELISCFRLILSVFKPIVKEMAAKTKKYLITKETKDVFIFRTSGFNRSSSLCTECQTETDKINLDAAVSLTGLRASELFQLIEAEKVHSLETAEGYLLLCAKSLEGLVIERFKD